MNARRIGLAPLEALSISLVGGLVCVDLLLFALRRPALDVGSYAALAFLVAVFLGFGLAYRRLGRDERLASTAVAIAILCAVTPAAGAYNYLLLPLGRPTVDGFLLRLDAALGIHWPDVLRLAAEWPSASRLLAICYDATFPLLAALHLALGLGGKTAALQRLGATVCVSALLTVLFWALFPSFGPSVMFTLPPDVLEAVRPLVDPGYGAELLRLAAEGPRLISPTDAKGLVAFPSYHSTVAILVVVFARHVRALLAVVLPINLLVLPAVVVHGGHHAVDIVGALACAAAALGIVRLLDRNRASAGRSLPSATPTPV